MYVLSREEMKSIDHFTIDDFGLSAGILMEYAGSGSVDFMMKHIFRGDKIAVFCGQGNNGGDGFVIARCLKNRGFQPVVFFTGDESRMSQETSLNFSLIHKMKIPVHSVTSPEKWEKIAADFFSFTDSDFSALVDAMFGIGFSGCLPGLYASIIDRLNQLSSLRFAIDISSGIDADTGWLETAFRADFTLSMAAPKLGHYLSKGREYSGTVIPIDIGIPQYVWQLKQPYVRLVNEESVKYPYRNSLYHKGHYGRVAIIAGSPGLSGAAIMSARAALHTGSGLITLFHHQGMENIFETALTEVMSRPLPFTEDDDLINKNFLADDLAELPECKKFLDTLNMYDVLLIGPGSGISPLTTALVNLITSAWDKPAVFDADALNILSHYPQWLKRIEGKPFILTPHIGEFARLMQTSPAEVLENIPAAIEQFLTEYDCHLLLKGITRIYAERSQMHFDISGNDGLATGGSGDVLSGIIISFLGQHLSPVQAAVSASYLLGTTAQTCTLYKKTPAITPSDIIDNIFVDPAL